jgi:hypothetical protein
MKTSEFTMLIYITLKALNFLEQNNVYIDKIFFQLYDNQDYKIKFLLDNLFSQDKELKLKQIKIYLKFFSSKNINNSFIYTHPNSAYSLFQYLKKFNFYINKYEKRSLELNFLDALKGLLLFEYFLENFEIKTNLK